MSSLFPVCERFKFRAVDDSIRKYNNDYDDITNEFNKFLVSEKNSRLRQVQKYAVMSQMNEFRSK